MKRVAIGLACILVAGVPALSNRMGGHGESDTSRSRAVIRLEVEPLLVDSSGIHPLNAAHENLVDIGKGGSFNAVARLGADKEAYLLYSLAYSLAHNGQIQLRLHRSLRRGEKEVEELPDLSHLLDPFDAWTVTVLEDAQSRSKLRLRVVPIIRPAVETVPFDSHRLTMWLYGGPLIQFSGSAEEDRVIFRDVNILQARALKLGVPGVGEIRLGLEQAPGEASCGFVRGHLLQFSLGGREYRIFSDREILPEDPSRPGGGWTLFGTIDRTVKIEQGKGYYGSAAPGS